MTGWSGRLPEEVWGGVTVHVAGLWGACAAHLEANGHCGWFGKPGSESGGPGWNVAAVGGLGLLLRWPLGLPIEPQAAFGRAAVPSVQRIRAQRVMYGAECK